MLLATVGVPARITTRLLVLPRCGDNLANPCCRSRDKGLAIWARCLGFGVLGAGFRV